MDVLSVAGVVASVVLCFWYWPRVPDSIPIHFGFAGEPDAWGSRSWLGMMVAVPIVVHTAFSILERIPGSLNFPVRITAENADVQIRLVRTFLSVLKAMIVWLGAYALWRTGAIALAHGASLGAWLLPSFLVCLAALMVAYLGAALARRKGGPSRNA